MKVLRGRVESGIGDFGQWVEKLSAYYEQKIGMKLYPGTLNTPSPVGGPSPEPIRDRT